MEESMAKRSGEVKTVRLSVDVDEATWRKLRHEAEQEREGPRGRASVNALLQRLIEAHLSKKGGK
jgi:hypothetical protein